MEGKSEKCQGAVCRKKILIVLKLMEIEWWILETRLPYFHIVVKFVKLTVQLWQYSCCPKILTMAATPKFHSGKAQY